MAEPDDDIESYWEGTRPPPKPFGDRVRDAVETGLYRFQAELTEEASFERNEEWMNQQRERAGPLAQALTPFVGQAPEGNFEDRVLIRSQQMVDDVIRRIPPTRENMSFLIRITDELRFNLVQYARRPGATMEAIEEFIRDELVPLEALASGAVNLAREEVTPEYLTRNPFTEIGVVNQTMEGQRQAFLVQDELRTRVLEEIVECSDLDRQSLRQLIELGFLFLSSGADHFVVIDGFTGALNSMGCRHLRVEGYSLNGTPVKGLSHLGAGSFPV
jgi:hypothetical protein